MLIKKCKIGLLKLKMASCGKVLESSNVCHFTKVTFFPFHRLPILVQWKIFRQYIPILYKAFIFYHITDFAKLLEYPQSWTKPSKGFFECFSLLCSLQKGVYVHFKNFAKKAYYVTMDQTQITFTLCSLDQTSSEYKVCAVSSECPINPFNSGLTMKVTLSIFHKFLMTFLSNYTLSRDHVIKIYEFCGFFFVNYSTNKMCWINGKMYDIVDSLCIVRLGTCRWYHIILKDNYRIEVRVNPMNPFQKEHEYYAMITKILTPISLETFLIFNGKQVYNYRNICEMKFQFLTDDDIMLHVHAFNPRMCLEYFDANIMDCLKCVKNVFNQCNKG